MSESEPDGEVLKKTTKKYIRARYPFIYVSESAASEVGAVSTIVGGVGVVTTGIDHISTAFNNRGGTESNRIQGKERINREINSLKETLVRQPDKITVDLGSGPDGRQHLAVYDTSTSEGTANYVRDTLTASSLGDAEALLKAVPATQGQRTGDSDAFLFSSLTQATEEHIAQIPDKALDSPGAWSTELLIGASALLFVGINLECRIVKSRNRRIDRRHALARDALKSNHLSPEGSKVYHAVLNNDYNKPSFRGGLKARAKARKRVEEALRTEESSVEE